MSLRGAEASARQEPIVPFRSRERDPVYQRARAEELLAQCRADARAWRWSVLIAFLGGVTGWATGLALVSWAVHTTDPWWGAIAFWSGLVIGNSGVVAALVWLRGRAAVFRW